MMKRNYLINKSKTFKVAFLFIFVSFFGVCQFPTGFQEINTSNWNAPIAIEIDNAGHLFVAEREGKLFKFEGGIKTLLLDISEEVASYGDFGLVSFTIDPSFITNGFVYLYYVVDRHHLLNFGTANYSASTTTQGATISRVTRFTVDISNFNSVVPNSKLVLVGETKESGFPLTGVNHAGGDIKFGEDGSLLVSFGDGAHGADYESQALADGIITQSEYNARRTWRVQIDNSLCGKIIRIDPSNGNGLATNPYFDNLNPRSPQSRIWAKGFRNPFRFTIKPGSGNSNIALGQPGVLYVGDVGNNLREELNIVKTSGSNYGWPRYEGNDIADSNPTYNPTSVKQPTIDWGRNSVVKFLVNNNLVLGGSASFPYSTFYGGCSIGGVFYKGDTFPEEYRNSYFMADFNSQWVKSFKFDSNENPISQNNFANTISGLVQFYYNKFNKSMYFVSVYGQIGELVYLENGNQNPKSIFKVSTNFGPSPLTINFDASDSSDPENQSLTYQWTFGDNTTGTGMTINHLFTAVSSNQQSFTVKLKVTDPSGNFNESSQIISLNNTPPNVISTSLDYQFIFNPTSNATINLAANVIDNEESNNTLTHEWDVTLYHDEHKHPEYNTNQNTGSFIFDVIPCTQSMHFYRFTYAVTDSYGLKTVYQKDLYPNCDETDTEPPSKPLIRVENFTAKSFDLKWAKIADNKNVKNIEVFINGISKIVLASNSTGYVFNSNIDLIGKNFTAHIIVRDEAGNSSKSAVLNFNTLINYCLNTTDKIYLSDLTPILDVNGNGPYERNQTNGDYLPNDGVPLKLNGVTFAKGLGVHSFSQLIYDVSNLHYSRFLSKIGVDDVINFGGIGSSCGLIQFTVHLDNQLKYTSPLMDHSSTTQTIDLDISNVQKIKLSVLDGGNGNCADHGDWADAKLTCLNTDYLAPSNPLQLNLNIGSPSGRQLSGLGLSWNPSIDNIDTQLNYQVILDGVKIYKGTQLTYSIINITVGSHEVSVQAIDYFGNISASEMQYFYACPSGLIILGNNINPVAKNDESLNNSSNSMVTLNIMENDEISCGNLVPSSVSLILPATDVSNIVIDNIGDVVGFRVVGEGDWAVNNSTGSISFAPLATFLSNPMVMKYTVRNSQGGLSNQANISVKYASALPIHLKLFYSKQSEKSIDTFWETENSIDFDRFELEKSNKQNEFKLIYSVVDNKEGLYSFEDKNLQNGLNYYRLKMIDLNGSYKYSPIISEKINNNYLLSNIINPVKNGEILLVTNLKKPTFLITSVEGKCFDYSITKNDESNYNIKIIGEKPGLYFITIRSGDIFEIKKFLNIGY